MKKSVKKQLKKQVKKQVAKAVIGDVLKAALAASNYKAVKGELRPVTSAAMYVTIGNRNAAFINKAGTDEPNVRLITSIKPKELGLNPKNWAKTNSDREYAFSGDYATLGKSLAVAFKALYSVQKKAA
jgi:hypothetical protein